MGRRKRMIKIPEVVTIKCPHCGKGSRAKVSIEVCPQVFTCEKCKREVRAPINSCCLICAFSKTKCPRSLWAEACVKGLEIK